MSFALISRLEYDARFRWAACQLDMLIYHPSTLRALNDALKSLPKTLAETYQRMIDRINEAPPGQRKWARQILEWLIFARRPLTLSEVASLTMIDADSDKPYSPDNKLLVEEDVLSICAGFITLRLNADHKRKRGMRRIGRLRIPDSQRATYHVVLAHLSVKEFLTSQDVRDATFRINPELSQVSIARSCIVIIQNGSKGLCNYAKGNWIMHVRDTLAVSNDRLECAVRDMFDPELDYLEDRQIWAGIEELLHEGPDSWQLLTFWDSCASSRALWYAAILGLCKISEWLLSEKEADVNADNSAALRLSARYGQEDTVDLLLRKGASVDGWNSQQDTALRCAAKHGHSNIARLLINSSAKVDSRSEAGKTALHKALGYGHKDVVRILINGAEANALEYLQQKDVDDRTALNYAVERGHTDIVRLLINKVGANTLEYLQQKDANGCTALHHAVGLGRTDIMRLPINEAGANTLEYLQQKDANGRTALHHAAVLDRTDIVRLLINEAGANTLEYLQQKDANGRTALHHAVGLGCTDIMRLLINEAGANTLEYLQQKDVNGRTALHHAAGLGRTYIVRLLINEAGANTLEYVQQKDVNGCTALYYALERGHTDIVRLLINERGEHLRLCSAER
jgi:ankyrin repeat protein